jgi:hypothetical protein
MAKPLPLNDRLSTAGHLVVRTRIFYDIWWYYEGAATRPLHIDAMRGHTGFFRFDPHAHFVSFIVHAAALFESRADTINIPRLVQEIESSNSISNDVIAQCRSLLSELGKYAPKIIILRSNLFAHRSSSIGYSNAFKIADVTPNELGVACEIALRIINLLLSAMGLQEHHFQSSPRDDLVAMLRALAATSS